SFIDAYRRHREPTAAELLGELKNTAWTCAAINAACCANYPPRLYVTTRLGQRKARCETKALPPAQQKRLRAAAHLAGHTRGVDAIEEVADHPLLTLLRSVNPVHNAFDLWELTQLSLETVGAAYWLLDLDGPFGTPAAIWPLPAHKVRPHRERNSADLLDW